MANMGSHATLDTPDFRDRHIYSISDLSEEFGVTARALRFYEDEGLIAPVRRGFTRSVIVRVSHGYCVPSVSGSAFRISAR
jgi:hypothetical protein